LLKRTTAWALSLLPADASTQRWAVLCDGQRCSHRSWLDALRDDAAARRVLTEALRASPFRAYLWETPAVFPDDDGTEAEMVVTESAALSRSRSDPSSFAEAFRASRSVATFANLRGDAVLVAPHPDHAPDSAHLAAFVRSAPDDIVDALWIAVSDAVSSWLATRRRRVWVSTSGLAVPWLHVRLDSTPKYYSYRPYTTVERRRSQ
jgi:hypothetical protein